MFNACTGKDLRKEFRLAYLDSTDKNRLSFLMCFLYLTKNSSIFTTLVLINGIVLVNTGNRLIRRDLDNIQAINLTEFGFLRKSCTCHTGKFLIHTEVVLECNGSKRFGFSFDLYALFRLDCLMQAIAESAAIHKTSGKVINDDDLTICDNVFLVTFHRTISFQGIIDIVLKIEVLRIRKVIHAEVLLCLLDTFRSKNRCSSLFINNIVAVSADIINIDFFICLNYDKFLKGFNKTVGLSIHIGRFAAHSGNNKRSSRFIDKDTIDLVDDSINEFTLNHLLFSVNHVITEVIESEFIIRTIRNIRIICFTAVGIIHVMNDQSDGKTKITVHLTHPFTISAGEVIINRNYVNSAAGKSIKINRQCSNKCFTFTCLHLSDSALMKNNTTDKLNLIRTKS